MLSENKLDQQSVSVDGSLILSSYSISTSATASMVIQHF